MTTKPLRVGVADAKARLAEIVREAPERRTIIQRRGKDVAVVIGVDELQRMEAMIEGRSGGERMLARVADWRERTGGVERFDPEPARFVPDEPFTRPRRRSSGG